MTSEKIPSRTEITILPADPPDSRKLGFTVWEYLGAEIRKTLDGPALLLESDVQVGDVVLVPGVSGYHEMMVRKDGDQFYAETHDGRWYSPLNFAEDDRGSWVSLGMINARGIRSLLVETSDS